MSNNKQRELSLLLKKEKAILVEDAAKRLNVSQNYVLGMLDSNPLYRFKNNFVILSGLGIENCIVCGEEADKYNSINVSIPEEILNGRKLDTSLRDSIRGHAKCYSDIDVFYRVENGLPCILCSSFSGQWIDGDEVKERCYHWGFSEFGHKGIIANNTMCNTFSPDYDLKSKYKKEYNLWLKLKPKIEERTKKGFKNLVTLLEKAHLIE